MDQRVYRAGGAGGLRIAVEAESATADANDATSVSEPAANTAASITLSAPGAGFRWVVDRIWAFYTGGVVNLQSLTVESPAGTFKLRYPMGTAADTVREIGGPVHGASNAAVVITLPAAGTGVSGRLYVSARKVREVAA